MAGPVSSLSFGSDSPLFRDLLRGLDGGASPACSWQAPTLAGVADGLPMERLRSPKRQRHAAPPPAAAADEEVAEADDAAPWKCLEGHAVGSEDCARCRGPPPPGVAESYQLVGDPGKKNGEKKLRGLLNKTPEWNCSAVREAEAVKAEARPGNESRDLAVALRAKSCASLRKCHLLRLCGAWGYGCSLWKVKELRRGDAPIDPPLPAPPTRVSPPKAEAAAATAAAAVAGGGGGGGAAARAHGGGGAAVVARAAPPPFAGVLATPGGWDYGAFSSQLPPDGAADHILSVLRGLALKCAFTFEGEAAREAAARLGAQHITPRVVDALAKVTKWLKNLLAEWGAQHAAVLGWSRRLDAGPPAQKSQVAWIALSTPGSAFSLETALALVASLAATSVAACAEKEAAGCTPSEAAWLREFGAGSLLGLEVISRLQALHNQFKFAPLASFLSVAARILELGMLSTNAIVANFEARDAWMRDMLAANAAAEIAGGGGDTATSGGGAIADHPAVFEFVGFPERVRPNGGVLLIEEGS